MAPLAMELLSSRTSSRRSSTSSGQRQELFWRYDAGDGQPLVVRASAKIDGPRTEHVLKPATVFSVSEEQLGEDGVLFLKLADGRGWVFDRKPGVGTMCTRALLWRYDAGDGNPLVVRATASIDGPRTEHTIAPGEVFCASQELPGDGGVLFLKLADGRGWAFNHKPGVGIMCKRYMSSKQASDMPREAACSVWTYDAGDGKPIIVRKEPNIDGVRTRETVKPGEVFRVKREQRGEGGVVYLELADGRGWLFDRKPGVSGKMCVKHEEVLLHIYDVPSQTALQRINGFARALGTGAFHAGVELFGQEWSFGCGCEGDAEDGTGVFSCAPRGCEGHAYRESLSLGHTPLNEEAVRQLLARLSKEWLAKDYSLLRRNCCHFSDEFCRELGVDEVPLWVRNLSGAGAVLDDGAKLIAEQRREMIRRGKLARGNSPSEAFRFGDLTIGVAKTVLDHTAEFVKGNELIRRVSMRASGPIQEARESFLQQFDCMSN